MQYVLPDFLVRAPLLRLRDLRAAERALARDPLGALAAAVAGAHPAALPRYARRAAFRPTPHGLWAGVTVGKLAARTHVASGTPRAHLTLSWARLAGLGRALLDDPELRERASLRCSPSLLAGRGRIAWLAPGGEAAEAEPDELLEAVLAAAGDWAPWPRLRALCPGGGDADDYLLSLVDDGLLAHDLTPPLVGPPPLAWMIERLGGHPVGRLLAEAAAELARLAADAPRDAARRRSLDRSARSAARYSRLVALTRDSLLAAGRLPGLEDLHGAGSPFHAVLVHQPRTPPTLARAAVQRAAALAPLLVRLQDALAPPAAERALDPSLAEALVAISERFGAGALAAAPLALGEYGVPFGGDGSRKPTAPLPALLSLLVDRISAAARAGAEEIELLPEELDAVLPPAPPPSTLELVLTPAGPRPGRPPGTDWLLGLHGPAGATWGRFAHALGAPLVAALARLAEAERAAGGPPRLDVDFAPAPDLADLTTHPAVRAGCLALTTWPAAAVPPAALEVVAAPGPAGLRAAGGPVVPSPLARLRSTTAPAGLYQLLVGWSLQRQHAPWALSLGPLADLAWLPRVRVAGFIVAPQSWRLPAPAGALPRHVQVGLEDELLPVDLRAPGAAEDLRGAPRAHEIWPPLGDTPDEDGRRIEAVLAVVDAPEAVVDAAPVPPPAVQPATAGWRTFRIYGAPDRQDRVLAGAVAPAVAAALAAGEIDAWFFLRYLDEPGPAHHLRLRVHGRRAAAFGPRLDAALAPAAAAGDVVSVEIAPYHRETARFGDYPAERVFQSESGLVLDLLALPDADGIDSLVRALDALCAAFGLDLAARRALAGERRAASGGDFAAEYRRRQRALVRLLAGLDDGEDAASPAFAGHGERLRGLPAPPARLLPALLHLTANRFAGPDAGAEALAYYLWERALEGVDRFRGTPAPAGTSSPRRRTSRGR